MSIGPVPTRSSPSYATFDLYTPNPSLVVHQTVEGIEGKDSNCKPLPIDQVTRVVSEALRESAGYCQDPLPIDFQPQRSCAFAPCCQLPIRIAPKRPNNTNADPLLLKIEQTLCNDYNALTHPYHPASVARRYIMHTLLALNNSDAVGFKQILTAVTDQTGKAVFHSDVQERVFYTALRWLQKNSLSLAEEGSLLHSLREYCFEICEPARFLQSLLCEIPSAKLTNWSEELAKLYQTRLHFALIRPMLTGLSKYPNKQREARLDLFNRIVSNLNDALSTQEKMQLLSLLILLQKEDLFSRILTKWSNSIDSSTLTKLSDFIFRLNEPEVLKEILNRTIFQVSEKCPQQLVCPLTSSEEDLVKILRVLLSCQMVSSESSSKSFSSRSDSDPENLATFLTRAPFYTSVYVKSSIPIQEQKQTKVQEQSKPFFRCRTYEEGTERANEIFQYCSELLKDNPSTSITFLTEIHESTSILLGHIQNVCSLAKRDTGQDDNLIALIETKQQERLPLEQPVLTAVPAASAEPAEEDLPPPLERAE